MIDGVVTETIDDGTLFITYKNGMKNGPMKLQLENGNLVFTANYQDDVLNGEYISYYPSGSVMSAMCYFNGKLHGKFVHYSENNMPILITHYVNGKYHGLYCCYDEFGDKLLEVMYENGVKNGQSISYYSKKQGGGRFEIANYCNNLLEGNKVSLYPNGKVMTVVPYIHGRAQKYPVTFSM